MYESFVMRVCAEIVWGFLLFYFFFNWGLFLCVWGEGCMHSLTAVFIGITSISLSVHKYEE